MGDEEAKDDEPFRDYARLSTTQRWLAGLVGLGGAGAGGAAIFISSNQAGSTTMLIVSLIFLLIAIQGTPIRRASKDSVELVGHEVARKVNEALEKAGPEAASEALDRYREVSPGLTNSPEVADAAFKVVDAHIYQRRLQAALERLVEPFWYVAEEVRRGRIIYDMTIGNNEDTRELHVAIRHVHHSRTLSSRDMRRFVRELEGDQTDSRLETGVPLLIVANAAIDFSISEGPVGVCTWRDESDDPILERELKRLLLEDPAT